MRTLDDLRKARKRATLEDARKFVRDWGLGASATIYRSGQGKGWGPYLLGVAVREEGD